MCGRLTLPGQRDNSKAGEVEGCTPFQHLDGKGRMVTVKLEDVTAGVRTVGIAPERVVRAAAVGRLDTGTPQVLYKKKAQIGLVGEG